MVWSGKFGSIGLVWFGKFGLVWFGLVNINDLRRPLVHLKLAKASLELHPGTIPGGIGSGGVGLVQ